MNLWFAFEIVRQSTKKIKFIMFPAYVTDKRENYLFINFNFVLILSFTNKLASNG